MVNITVDVNLHVRPGKAIYPSSDVPDKNRAIGSANVRGSADAGFGYGAAAPGKPETNAARGVPGCGCEAAEVRAMRSHDNARRRTRDFGGGKNDYDIGGTGAESYSGNLRTGYRINAGDKKRTADYGVPGMKKGVRKSVTNTAAARNIGRGVASVRQQERAHGIKPGHTIYLNRQGSAPEKVSHATGNIIRTENGNEYHASKILRSAPEPFVGGGRRVPSKF